MHRIERRVKDHEGLSYSISSTAKQTEGTSRTFPTSMPVRRLRKLPPKRSSERRTARSDEKRPRNMSFLKKLFDRSSTVQSSVSSEDTDLATVVAISHNSTKLHRGETPELCIVGVPFGGMKNIPSDTTGVWIADQRLLRRHMRFQLAM